MNKKGYLITVKKSIEKDNFLSKFTVTNTYIRELKLPLIIYKDKKQLDEIDISVPPGFRMNGFLVLNFNRRDEELICKHVKNLLNNDTFISETSNKNEIIAEEEIRFNEIKDLIKEVNAILANYGLKLTQNNILKISEIKVMPKEEKKMDIKELLATSIRPSLSYLLIENGKLSIKNKISAPSNELNGFVFASRLSSVFLNNFPGMHSDLKKRKSGNITLHDKSGEKIILFKQFKVKNNNYSLAFECTRQIELENAKEDILKLDKQL